VNPGYSIHDLLGGYGPLITGNAYAPFYKLAIILHPLAVLFNYQQRVPNHIFIGGEPAMAIKALPAAADGTIAVDVPAVHYLILR